MLNIKAILKRLRFRYRATVGPILIRQRQKKATIKKIVVGSSGIRQRDWILTEQATLDVTSASSWSRCFERSTIDNIFAEHVWEHLTIAEARSANVNCFNYLKPGGRLRLAVPDGLHPDPLYIAAVDVNGTGDGGHDHKVLYTYRTLSAELVAAGFDVQVLEYFDERGTFTRRDWNTADGLVRRSSQYDQRNIDRPLAYTSLIVDAIKPNVA